MIRSFLSVFINFYMILKLFIRKRGIILILFLQENNSGGRIYKNMWRKVGDCGTFRVESGGSGHVYG
ncbi:hypothetical protein DOE78_07670 [Bacillus sp. Y1]|nr:hypothetical protein DOE78_07670 [Bacillus sp. Y1]